MVITMSAPEVTNSAQEYVAAMIKQGLPQEMIPTAQAYTEVMFSANLPPADLKAHLDQFWTNAIKAQTPELWTPEERELVQEKKPAPPPLNAFAEFLQDWKKDAPAREKRYRQAAKPLCKKYKLDVERDKAQIQALIAAAQRLEQCASCNGNCAYPMHRPFETYSISDSGQISWVPCAVEVRRLIAQKLPKKFADKTFDDYELTGDNKNAVGAANWFLSPAEKGVKNSLYFYGGVGTGKTFLATLIAKELIKRGRGVVFKNMPALLNELKETFNNPQLSSQTILRRFINCEILFLDDVGVGKISDWNMDILFQIINSRGEANRPMIMTSNYGLSELESKIKAVDSVSAARITSRLSELCHFINLGNFDRRRGA